MLLIWASRDRDHHVAKMEAPRIPSWNYIIKFRGQGLGFAGPQLGHAMAYP